MIAIGLALMAGMSTADIFHPISEIATPGMTNGLGDGQELNMIEGAGFGFEADLPHSRIGDFWYTNAVTNNYITGHAGDEKLFFDLGSDVVLGEISVWGYLSNNGNGLREFNVSFATNAGGGDTLLGDEAYGSSITLNPAYTASSNPLQRQSFRFGEPITARYVAVWVTSNYAGIITGGDRLGIGEIAFASYTVAGASDIEVADVDFAFSSSLANYDIPVTNTGEFDLNIIGTPTFSGPDAHAFSVAGMPGPITTWDTENISVQLDPVGLTGRVSATMTIPSVDPEEPSVDVEITGIVGPIIDVTTPAVLSLGNTIETFDIEIRNGGGEELSITEATFVRAHAPSFLLTNIPSTIAPGEGETVTFQFDPTGLESGQVYVSLRIFSNDPVNPVTNVQIYGGVPHAFHPILEVYSNTTNHYSDRNLIDGPGGGFDDRWPHTSIGSGIDATWVTNNPHGAASYYTNGQAPPVLQFDLGQDRPLSEISTWGYSDGNTNGGRMFSLRFATSTDGPTGYGTSITYIPVFEAGFDATIRDSHAFRQTVEAQYVEMSIIDNWRGLQDPLAGGDRVGLGEVAFENGPPIIPQPPFKVLDVTATAMGVDLTFESNPSIIYKLSRSVDGKIWQLLPGLAVGEAGETTVIRDIAPPANSVVFYRVINTGEMVP